MPSVPSASVSARPACIRPTLSASSSHPWAGGAGQSWTDLLLPESGRRRAWIRADLRRSSKWEMRWWWKTSWADFLFFFWQGRSFGEYTQLVNGWMHQIFAGSPQIRRNAPSRYSTKLDTRRMVDGPSVALSGGLMITFYDVGSTLSEKRMWSGSATTAPTRKTA